MDVGDTRLELVIQAPKTYVLTNYTNLQSATIKKFKEYCS